MPDDIKQGNLGDCYFLSVLSILAERPHRIERLFINKEINDAGLFGLNIIKDGQSQDILLDNYFPCTYH